MKTNAEVTSALSTTGVSLMRVSSINLFREVRAPLASNREDIRSYRDLQRRREANMASGRE